MFFCLFFVDVLFVRFQFIYSDTTSTMADTCVSKVDTNSSPASPASAPSNAPAPSSAPSNAPAPSSAPSHAPTHAPSLSPHSPHIGVGSLLDNEGIVHSDVTANDVIGLLLMQIIMLFGVGDEPTSAVATSAVATSAAIKRMSIVEKTPTQQEQKHRTTNQMWNILESNDLNVPKGLTECGRSITEFLDIARIEQFLLSPPSTLLLSTCNSHIDELLEIWKVIYNDLVLSVRTPFGFIDKNHFELFKLIGELNKDVTTKIKSIKNALISSELC